MKRRDFLRISAGSIVGTMAGTTGLLTWMPRAFAATIPVNLSIMAGYFPMIDNTQSYLFSFSESGAMEFPGPTIICQEGDTIAVSLSNTLNTQSSFVVGDTSINQAVSAGSSINFSFSAPAPGSYLYYDGLNNGVNRVMGLHGTLVVMPSGVKTQAFVGGPQFVRQYKWVLADIDSMWGELVKSGGDNYVTNASLNINTFKPNYFTINGQSFNLTQNTNTQLMGLVGEPALVRILNAGLAAHSPHFHGNHVEICSINHQNFASNRKEKDIVSMFPLDARDVIFPFRTPPDAWPPVTGEQHYPMHCHFEMSQTAGGGMYPHGMHTGIVIGKAPTEESELTQGVNAL